MHTKIHSLRVVLSGCPEGNSIEKEARWEGGDVSDKMENHPSDRSEANVLDPFISKTNKMSE